MNYEVALDHAENTEPEMPTTFVVKVIYSENASIQGYIQWIEQEKTLPFRSLMEFIHLIEDALRKRKKGMINFRSWDN